MSPDCNSFNAEYSKKGILERSEENSTGREYGSRYYFSRLDETRHQHAFTLAEVLITLSIIGVVAALTIPSLIFNNQEKETVTRLKKAYNIFSNAYSLAQIQYGEAKGWEWGKINTLEGSSIILNRFSPYLNIVRRCEGESGCFKKGVMYKMPNGSPDTVKDDDRTKSKTILADGMNFYFWSGGACNVYYGPGKLSNSCAILSIDINGMRGPAVWGKDMFSFYLTPSGLIPAGTIEDSFNPPKSCTTDRGAGCTAWVLLKENMDYKNIINEWGSIDEP